MNENELNEKMLMAYIGNNYDKIINNKFSICSFFLNWIYVAYRKFYSLLAILIGVIMIIIFLPDSLFTIIALVTNIILGLFFNKWYVLYAKKRTNKIKQDNANATEAELISICKKKGGIGYAPIFITLGICFIIGIIFNSFKTTNINDLSSVDIQKYVGIVNTEKDLTTYNIDLYNVVKDLEKIDDIKNLGDYNISLNFKIKAYDIKLNLVNGPYDDVIAFDLYINNTLISRDGYAKKWDQYLVMYTLGDNIINEVHFKTNVFDGFDIISIENGKVKINRITELESISGMRFSEIKLSSDGITIRGSRLTHGPSISYNGKNYMIMYKNDCNDALNILSSNLIVKSTYTYKYDNGILQENPVISDKVTLGEYISNDVSVCY